MRTMLGFCEIAILVWGIVECWGTPWAAVALIWLFIDICLAFYLTEQQRVKKQQLQDAFYELLKGLEKKDE